MSLYYALLLKHDYCELRIHYLQVPLWLSLVARVATSYLRCHIHVLYSKLPGPFLTQKQIAFFLLLSLFYYEWTRRDLNPKPSALLVCYLLTCKADALPWSYGPINDGKGHACTIVLYNLFFYFALYCAFGIPLAPGGFYTASLYPLIYPSETD